MGIASVISVASVAPVGAAAGAGRRFTLLLNQLIGFVDLLHLLLREIRERIVVIIVRMIFAGKLTIGFFDLVIRSGRRNIQDFIGVCHTVSSNLLFFCS